MAINKATKYLTDKYDIRTISHYEGVKNHNDKLLCCLVGQYYFGIKAKVELKDLVCKMKL